MFSFLVLINDTGFTTENREIGLKMTQAVNKRKEIATQHWKYVDDMTIAESIDLKITLKKADPGSLDLLLTTTEQSKYS